MTPKEAYGWLAPKLPIAKRAILGALYDATNPIADEGGVVAPLLCADLIRHIPQQPQRQDATNSQLCDLYAFARRCGYFEAAEAIKPDDVVLPANAGALLAKGLPENLLTPLNAIRVEAKALPGEYCPSSMRASLCDLLRTLPLQSARTDSLRVQLNELRSLANRIGCYDAADIVRVCFESIRGD